MLERHFLRLHDAVAARPRTVLLLVVLAAAAAVPVLAQARLDVSFRPLFADDEASTARTREFSAQFGQPGGAWIGAVLEVRQGGGPGAAHAAAARAATVLEALPHAVEVLAPPAAGTLSADGAHALVMARLDLPLEALEARSRVVREMQQRIDAALDAALDTALDTAPGDAPGRAAAAHYVGVSVVETVYARLVLNSMGLAFLLNTLAVLVVLRLLFGGPGGVLVPLSGVLAGTPLALAAMVVAGQKLTIVNSIVPTVMLIVGVADGLHMVHAFVQQRAAGQARAAAARAMAARMALPCLLTTVTTACGFLALQAAGVAAVRDFGGNVAVGVVVVWATSLLTVPALLHALPDRWLPVAGAGGQRLARRWALATHRFVLRRDRLIMAGAAVSVAVMGLSLPRLVVDQRFNEEVAAAHPVRSAQALLEREFGGFLGPELLIRRHDGGVTDPAALPMLEAAAAAVAALPDVHRVEGPLLARDAALLVRTGDVGTTRALALAHEARAAAAAALGGGWHVDVVGEWWLAQLGMAGLLRDMLAGFAVSALLLLPILALALRDGRLLLVAIVANLFPLLFALAFMAWTGIAVRIGTSMILAIALAIGVDDTVHIMARLKEEARLRPPRAALRRALRGAGAGVFFTTIVLVAGFAAMAASPLLAIRDMGAVAAATLLAAFLSDVWLAPALYLLAARGGTAAPRRAAGLRNAGDDATSCDGSVRRAAPASFPA